MAVQLVATIKRWIGLAADVKPTSAPVGSIYFSHDTGATSMWTGSAWTDVTGTGVVWFNT